MSKALVNRSLTTVRTELEFLLDSNVITQQFFDTVTKSLPERYTEGAAPANIGAGGAVPAQVLEKAQPPPSYPSNSSAGPEEWVEALYDYAAQQPEDLPLRRGDRIRVIDKPNPNWSKGISNGRTGMFPSNYTKPVEKHDPYYDEKNRSSTSIPPPQYQQPQYQPQQYQPPAPFPPASTNYYQPPAQQQPEVAAQPQSEGHLKKFGKKFGNAAIFGAGATVGGDIINSIF